MDSGGPPGPTAFARLWVPGVVRIYRPDGSFVTSRHLREGQTLETELAAGTYQAVGHSGDARCEPKTFTVRAADIVTVRIVFVVF